MGGWREKVRGTCRRVVVIGWTLRKCTVQWSVKQVLKQVSPHVKSHFKKPHMLPEAKVHRSQRNLNDNGILVIVRAENLGYSHHGMSGLVHTVSFRV